MEDVAPSGYNSPFICPFLWVWTKIGKSIQGVKDEWHVAAP